VCTFKITSLLIKRSKCVRHLRAFPGPPAHWFFGHALELMPETVLDKSVAWGVDYPFAYPMWVGPFLSILSIHQPDYVKTMLFSTEPKDDLAYRFIKPWIGDGLLVSSGQKWFNHRRLLTPGFHFNILKPYVKLMADSCKLMLDKWEAYSQTNELFEVSGPAVYELSDLINMRVRVFLYHIDFIFHLSPHGFRFRRACQEAHRYTSMEIASFPYQQPSRPSEILRKEALKEEAELEKIQAKRKLDFLDILLCARDEDQKGLSDEAIRAEVETFMFEGHDTTASGISFLFYSLASNPQHQEICREEILQVLGDRETLEWDDLNRIPYTTMCIKESLRLYPAVPGIVRKLTKTMTFFDGRSMPEENISKRHPHAFLPFSAGSRNCIGQNFAMNEMKVVISQTLSRYQLMVDPARPPKISPRLVLCSLNGIYIKINPLVEVKL
ncbi:hypothetical protein CRUP_000923, partial [Coryphaenoides rupestris]